MHEDVGFIGECTMTNDTVQLILEEYEYQTLYIVTLVIPECLFHHLPIVSVQIVFLQSVQYFRLFIDTFVSQYKGQLVIGGHSTSGSDRKHHIDDLLCTHTRMYHRGTFATVLDCFEELQMFLYDACFQFKWDIALCCINRCHICCKDGSFFLEVEQPVIFIGWFLALAIDEITTFGLWINTHHSVLDSEWIAIQNQYFNALDADS